MAKRHYIPITSDVPGVSDSKCAFIRKVIRTALAAVDGNEAMDELDATGALVLRDGEDEIRLTKDDLLISTAKTEGYVSVEDKGVTVVLDTTLTPALIEEGNVREVVSKVQTMRKEAGFEVTDHIRLAATGNADVEALIARNRDAICADTLADEYLPGGTLAYAKEWNINGMVVTLSVERK